MATSTDNLVRGDDVVPVVRQSDNSHLYVPIDELLDTLVFDDDVQVGDDIDIALGSASGGDVNMRFATTGDTSNPSFVIGLDDTSQQIHITDKGAINSDWGRSGGTHPELMIHSNASPISNYLSLGKHNGTNAAIDVVGGSTLLFLLSGTTAATLTATGFVPTKDTALGSATSELGDIFIGDNKQIKFGDGQDVSVDWDGTLLVSSSAENAMWDDCPSKLDPNYLSNSFDFEDDFMSLDTTATVGDWAAFEVDVATGAAPALDATAAGVGGILLLTMGGATDDDAQQINAVNAPFFLAAGKTIYYETRLKIVGDNQSEVSFGLCGLAENLTAVADVLPADGISFSSQDATLAVDLTLSKGGTNTGAVSGVKTMVSGTYVTFGFKVSGVSSVTPYIDGVAGTPATATIPDDKVLTPYFLVRNGDGTTNQVLHVDYVRVVQLR